MIYERIKELRKENGLTQEQVAQVLGKKREVYRRYECGERAIRAEDIVVLAKLYNVSTDYILGITDKRKSY